MTSEEGEDRHVSFRATSEIRDYEIAEAPEAVAAATSRCEPLANSDAVCRCRCVSLVCGDDCGQYPSVSRVVHWLLDPYDRSFRFEIAIVFAVTLVFAPFAKYSVSIFVGYWLLWEVFSLLVQQRAAASCELHRNYRFVTAARMGRRGVVVASALVVFILVQRAKTLWLRQRVLP